MNQLKRWTPLLIITGALSIILLFSLFSSKPNPLPLRIPIATPLPHPMETLYIGFAPEKPPFVLAKELQSFDPDSIGSYGVLITLFYALLEEENIHLVPHFLPYERIEGMLQTGELHGGILPMNTPLQGYTKIPLFSFGNALISTKTTPLCLDSTEFAQLKIIGWHGAYEHMGRAYQDFVSQTLHYAERMMIEDQYEMLIHGQVDAVIRDTLIFQWFIKMQTEAGSPPPFLFQITPLPSTIIERHYALFIQSTKIAEIMKKNIEQLQSNGKADSIWHNYQ